MGFFEKRISFACDRCGRKFRVRESKCKKVIYTYQYRSYFGRYNLCPYDVYRAVCPICGRKVEVKKEDHINGNC